MAKRNRPASVPLSAPRPRRTAVRAGSAAVAAAASAALLAAGAAPAAAEAAAGVADLRSDIDSLLADSRLEGATSGVLVRSLTRGDVLYRDSARTELIPASNAKLLTSAAAMEVLGADYRFTTTVSAGEDPGDGVVDGDLHLVGTGDPTLTAGAVDDLAAEVADSGVTEVTGDLVADDTWFDAERLSPAWDPADRPYYYSAQISALTLAANSDYDTGVVDVDATPGAAPGDAVDAALSPMTDNLSLANEAATGAAGASSTFGVSRKPDTNDFTAEGTLPVGRTYSTLRTVDEPTDHAAHLFAASLEEHGVKVAGGVGRGTAPQRSAPVAERSSIELGELLTPFLKLSNNGHAEILTKAMGREAAGEGSWEAGIAVATRALHRLGVSTHAVELDDGSGLARTDRLTAATTVRLLERVRHQPWFGTWRDALPLAGAPEHMVGGTLSGRMGDTAAAGNVRAKTGTLSGVSALSGYVTTAGGERLVFSIINNGYDGAAPRDIQDAIAVRLAEFTRGGTVEAARPLAAQRTAPDSPAADLECTWAGTC
ncbi:D-alanyl-D-alanine carboxypeptidase/D-alanyl-D-alanine endopeptidase [Streptomonospora wellingtoniae]|uniref:D-alanyl-D-alanine carboxypeptidase/D-alanyl-D-alanine-endopeptidase n=1 Tax=Streptomonospora wellingtoniae TaxID=3075544 RepID=A0ABU2KZ93_9ACTN|nr:D-alanyl-D-alanine carboxypeptidase/D-alanyl-D-alanine-endopeptidase [Streptomonospora sp. DSM 45055]MDT0304630.1 D-alanyl-D-alanine carboxypeptidase/D-alanyl-D-alanine-endopeptidase [Streptomonospora sp. DSM 45055]